MMRDPLSSVYLVEIVVSDPEKRIVKRRRTNTDTVTPEYVTDAVRRATQRLRYEQPLVETPRGYQFGTDAIWDVRVNIYTLLAP